MGLFSGEMLPNEAGERISDAVRELMARDVNDLLTRDIEVLIDEVVPEFDTVTIDWDHLTRSEVTTTSESFPDGWGGRGSRTVARTTLKVPIEGDALLLTYRSPNGYPGFSAVEGTARPGELSFEWTGSLDADPDAFTTFVDRQRNRVEPFLAYNNRDVPALNAQMRTEVRAAIERRKSDELKRRNLSANIPFPIERRPEATSLIRVQRRKVQTWTTPARPDFQPEPAIDLHTYDEILRDCVAMATVFERTPLTGIGEEVLRNLILGMLNTNYTGQTAGELFNGAGKTDICVREEDRNVFIGECKFYQGPASVSRAVDQLLSYLVWRDTKAALLLFVQRGNFTAAVTKAVDAIAGHAQCARQLPSSEPTRRNDFVFTRTDDPNRSIHLALLPFHLLGVDAGIPQT